VSPEEAAKAGALRGVLEVLRARRPDLSWQVGIPVKGADREPLSLDGEPGGVAVGDEPHTVGTPAPLDPDDIERAA
jgi:hypothetical protein